jgi:2-succinyl-5-enolpyruvyl-6-hydroxy-3-cyclohexene-1-carboxylate synthase
VYAEASSDVRFRRLDPALAEPLVDASLLWSHPKLTRSKFAPDLLLQIGDPPTSPVFEAWASRSEASLHVVAESPFADASGAAGGVLSCDIDACLDGLLEALDVTTPPKPSYVDRLRPLCEETWAALDGAIAAPSPQFREEQAIRVLFDALPDGALLCVGNSLPIRHLDAQIRGGRHELTTWSQRGANGIDGIVSGAAGAARAHDGPTVALLGDISFLHDVGGLWATRQLTTPLVLMVIDNGGGRIFERLPLGKTDVSLDSWTTPHNLPLHAAGPLFEVASRMVDTPEALRQALAAGLEHPGATLVQVRVAFDRDDGLVESVERALADRFSDQ